ncbi:hypothetical protein FLL78_18950 [Vibrio cholerae]|uniref:hypothetical protein n=1 Tax=Vibrio cholerae TaxID=666 RepID=UPI001157856D|nr:hypothetical protein [Vibrio cholerae]TQP95438.1 hypothetical protein FLL78_18950 [Vibrio cholerae]
MKINHTCIVCVGERKSMADATKLVSVTDSRAYPLECKFGHQTIVFLSDFKFQILFEIGLHAIKDGYYREAVSSFSAALERFYEHFTKTVLFRKEGADYLDKCWKLVSNQSERQLGAFIFLYLSEVGELPTILKSEDSGFRNSVIHKGKIPTKQEAITFGQKVSDLIMPKFEILLDNYWDQSLDMLFSQDLDLDPEHYGKPASSRDINAFLSTITKEKSVAEYVEELV